MQTDLDLNYPELNIQLLGINKDRYSYGNSMMTAGNDIPWLQDVDVDGIPGSDVWTSWGVTFRDVVILDGNNEWVQTFNLSTHDLAIEEEYKALRQLLIEVAKIPEPTSLALLAIASFGMLLRRKSPKTRIW